MSAAKRVEPAKVSDERPLLTPDEHAARPLTREEWRRRAALLSWVREANRRHRR